jgi:hypothetical protein
MAKQLGVAISKSHTSIASKQKRTEPHPYQAHRSQGSVHCVPRIWKVKEAAARAHLGGSEVLDDY